MHMKLPCRRVCWQETERTGGEGFRGVVLACCKFETSSKFAEFGRAMKRTCPISEDLFLREEREVLNAQSRVLCWSTRSSLPAGYEASPEQTRESRVYMRGAGTWRI